MDAPLPRAHTTVGMVPSLVLASQGSEPAERAAVAAAGGAARGSTAYLNLESGNCHGDLEATTGALIAAGVPPCAFARGAVPGSTLSTCVAEFNLHVEKLSKLRHAVGSML